MDKYTALWWANEHPFDKIAHGRKYYPTLHYSAIGDKEVTEIFNKEMNK